MDIALEAGISLRSIRNPQERVPQPAVTALWRKGVEATGDPCFGLHVPRHVFKRWTGTSPARFAGDGE